MRKFWQPSSHKQGKRLLFFSKKESVNRNGLRLFFLYKKTVGWAGEFF